MRSTAVQEQRELGRELRGEGELRAERVQLEGARAVVQAVVVEAKLAKGDEEAAAAPAGAGQAAFVDERAEVGDDGVGFGLVDEDLAVEDGLGGVWAAGWGVLCGGFVFGVVLVGVWMRGVEDGRGAGVDSCGGVDGVCYCVVCLSWPEYTRNNSEIGWNNISRYSLAIARASRELLKLEPVTMSLVQPT